MADLEADLNFMDYTYASIRRPIRRIVDETLLMAQELNLLDSDRHKALYRSISDIDNRLRSIFNELNNARTHVLSVKLTEASENAPLIGGKAAGLVGLRRILPDHVPDGFIITTEAYRLFMKENGLNERIRALIHDLSHVEDSDLFRSRLQAARKLFKSAALPEPIRKAITDHANSMNDDAETKWAVRSSSVLEDNEFTFAGQFDSVLGVEADRLESAYIDVLASRFSHRAMRYRLDHGIREIDTPMAVLFMPLIQPRFAGVLYTYALGKDGTQGMLASAVPGLADTMIRGEKNADTFFLSREEEPSLLRQEPAIDLSSQTPLYSKRIPEEMLEKLGKLAFFVAKAIGHDMDLEWAIDSDDAIWLLQGRKLHRGDSTEQEKYRERETMPIVEQGVTIFPGRAEGPVEYLSEKGELALSKKGAIVVVAQATPKLAPLLPHIGGLLVEEGNPVGHLATLVREFAVPCLFNVGEAVWQLGQGSVVSMDATKRRIYRGTKWPGLRDRMLARIRSRNPKKVSGPLHESVLMLNLDDPHRSDFKPKNCKSLHDTIRYIHEMSVRSMFALGDRQNRIWRQRAIPIETPIQIKTKLIDLDGSTLMEGKKLSPSKVFSHPFQAFWQGLSSATVAWERRSNPALEALPKDFVEQVMGGSKGPRRPSDTNYFIIAKDYMNFNARFVFHYAMVDAVAGSGIEKNYVTFRFQGGGASEANRKRRAKFLEVVLTIIRFQCRLSGRYRSSMVQVPPEKRDGRSLGNVGKIDGLRA